MKICVSLYQLWIIEVTYFINKEYIFNVFGGFELNWYSYDCRILIYILWNSWESMFVGNQNFPILWGRNFVGSQFVIIFINIKRLWWCKVLGKGYPWKQRTLIPHEQWRFHSNSFHTRIKAVFSDNIRYNFFINPGT